MPTFELLGAMGDETRLVCEPTSGVSLSLGGRPLTLTAPLLPMQDPPRYDSIVTQSDLAVEHGFRLDDVPTPMDGAAIAAAFATAYARNRAEGTPSVQGIPSHLVPPGVTGAAQAMYPLRTPGMMEQLWLLVRPSASGLQALYHTTWFRNADVNIIQWSHLRASMVDQYAWSPGAPRTEAASLWPPSTFALPSAKLALTEAAWAEAEAKRQALPEVDGTQVRKIIDVLFDFVRTDSPPRAPLAVADFSNRITNVLLAVGTQTTEVLVRNLEFCETHHDLRAWVLQCYWALGNRESLQVGN